MNALVANLSFQGTHWARPAAVLLAVALVVLIWSYRRFRTKTMHHFAAFTLKLLGFAILALCLIEPLWSGTSAKSGENLFVVMADNSQGMQIRDPGSSQSRGQVLQSAIEPEKSQWLGKLAGEFQVRRYVFDSRLSKTEDFSELNFNGSTSAIGTSLQTIAKRYRGKPLAGILLLTDGNATDMAGGQLDLTEMPPVYPVVIGHDQPEKDLAVEGVSVRHTSFEDAPVTVRANIRAKGYDGKTVAVELLDKSLKQVRRQTGIVSENDEMLTFHFQLQPQQPGVSFYRIKVSQESSDSDEEVSQVSEATLANNEKPFVVDRPKGPYRILYVTGRPNWEYKFLRRAVEPDDQMQLVALIRVAKREPKFDWRGRSGETRNPLFRGFDKKDPEDAERYDQPVLIRLNVRDESELRDGFPKSPEQLYAYHAVILDDLEAEFFTPDQMELIQRFVKVRGGGLLMLGGQESFHQGKYDRTPIEQVLPVYIDRLPKISHTHLRLNLTREGLLEPWARLRDNQEQEQARLAAMPQFRVFNPVQSVKPGASVIATLGPTDSASVEQYPALVVQRYGSGRSAALMVGDLWRWGMKQPELREDMEKSWRQMLRWLIADVPERISILAEHQRDRANQSVVLKVQVREKNFEPMDNAAVTIELVDAKGKAIRLSAEPTGEAGQFEATYLPRTTGSYRARAVVRDINDKLEGEAEIGWTVDFASQEFKSLKTNRALLESIASQTDGEVIELDELDHFVQGLPHRKAPIMENWSKPLWHTWVVFMLALACFAGEWALRRWKGLP